MRKIAKQHIVIAFFILNSFSFYSQTESRQANYYKWFDTVVGVGNTDLYNGIQYKRIYNTINNNHEYFLSPNFIKGTVLYSDQPYFDIYLKYDIYNDELIANLPSFNSYNTIQLIQQKVTSFSFNNHNFVKLSAENVSGFYEILFEDSNIKFYKKYLKNIKKHLDKNFVYYVFKEKEAYLLYCNNQYYQIKSKSNISKALPNLKKDINLFYKNNVNLRKTDYELFLSKLSSYLSEIISNN
ncbi:hypothetical protein MHL31_12225 [Lutibacter sp. A80]|uniref:hypothetical protein n=1 Tax=Lutibacter sp. A80 TaxID=2918453 RepID=UPI001F05ABCB|nr:hypothetical protein [Lutibacter sp. A80]UMB59839.1 hypothetical protein MHL31_12225 [Lutibacter sp. A80]